MTNMPGRKGMQGLRPGTVLVMMVLAAVLRASAACPAFPGPGADSIPKDTVRRKAVQKVTLATRFLQSSMDIPYQAGLFLSKDFRDDRITGTEQALAGSPGWFLQSRYGEREVRFTGRGFGNRTDGDLRGVRVLIDGIPEPEPVTNAQLDAVCLTNIRRIEALNSDASSLYANAPGGAVNFINDLSFNRSSVSLVNQVGSSGLFENGLRVAVKTARYRFLASYSYLNFDGYRSHSGSYRHIVNVLLESVLSPNSKIVVLGYYTGGTVRLPGALTRTEYESDPYGANEWNKNLDKRRITSRGRLAIRYKLAFGQRKNNKLEVTGFSHISFSELAMADYRIDNRYTVGLIARYANKSTIGIRTNLVTAGGEISDQPGRTEVYANLMGVRDPLVRQVLKSGILRRGAYLADRFEILPGRLFTLLTARFDNVKYNSSQETYPSLSGSKSFNVFSPRLSLDYRIIPALTLFASYGWSSNMPVAGEMAGYDSATLLNTRLEPQHYGCFEAGLKGEVDRGGKTFLESLDFSATIFYGSTSNEIIPFIHDGDTYFRNAAKSTRLGFEATARAEILRGLSLGIDYTWSRFTWDSYEWMSTGSGGGMPDVTVYADYSGNRLPGVPEHHLFLSLGYRHSFGRHAGIFARGTYEGYSSQWMDDENSERSGAVNLLNGALGTDLSFGDFKVTLAGGLNNILDAVYVGYVDVNAVNSMFYEAGAPRNVYLTLNFGYTF